MNPSFFPRPRYWAEAAEQKKHSHMMTLESLIMLLLMLIASVIQSILLGTALSVWMLTARSTEFHAFLSKGSISLSEAIVWIDSMTPSWMFYLTLLSNIALAIVVLFYCKKIEKRKLRTLGLTGSAPVPEFFLGLLVGAALFCTVFFLGRAAGIYRIESMQFSAELLLPLGLCFLGFLIQGASEELLIRGYYAVSLNKRYSVAACVIASSVMFSLLNLGDSAFSLLPALNGLLFGVFLCMYILKRGSIWGACAIHSIWNFTQCCIFGFPIGGLGKGNSLFSVWASPYNDLLSGGVYGPEGGICTTIILLAALIAVFVLRPKEDVSAQQAQSSKDTAEP